MQTLSDVGLGYIKLGQPAPTLSGGEAQRIKLASELHKRATGNTLYVLDEPTTGLHFEDIRKLLCGAAAPRRAGNTVLVIEHNLDVIKTADWVIDLGPEGGDGGGEIVAAGPPEEIATNPDSHTGQFLARGARDASAGARTGRCRRRGSVAGMQGPGRKRCLQPTAGLLGCATPCPTRLLASVFVLGPRDGRVRRLGASRHHRPGKRARVRRRRRRFHRQRGPDRRRSPSTTTARPSCPTSGSPRSSRPARSRSRGPSARRLSAVRAPRERRGRHLHARSRRDGQAAAEPREHPVRAGDREVDRDHDAGGRQRDEPGDRRSGRRPRGLGLRHRPVVRRGGRVERLLRGAHRQASLEGEGGGAARVAGHRRRPGRQRVDRLRRRHRRHATVQVAIRSGGSGRRRRSPRSVRAAAVRRRAGSRSASRRAGPVVAYRMRPAGRRWARSSTAGAWQPQDIEASAEGIGLSMAVDGDGGALAAYYTGDGSVHQAAFDGGALDGGCRCGCRGGRERAPGKPPASAIDGDGTAYITWYDPATDSVALASDRAARAPSRRSRHPGRWAEACPRSRCWRTARTSS